MTGRQWRRKRAAGIPAFAVWLFGGTLFATPVSAQEARVAEVAQALAAMRADVDELRFVMGAPVVAPAPWSVNSAGARHLFYTSQTLFRKVNRLANELAAEPMTEPPGHDGPEGAAEAALNVLALAHAELRALLERVGTEPAPAPAPAANPVLADTLVQMVETSRQLNVMLVHEYRPTETYELVRQAIRQLGEPFPPLPRLVGGVTPTGIYQKLLDCYRLVWQAERRRDMRPLGLNLRRERRRVDVEASDAYDLAQLLLADIAYMVGRQEDAPALPYRRPPYVYSAHVHRLASVLEAQLGAVAR